MSLLSSTLLLRTVTPFSAASACAALCQRKEVEPPLTLEGKFKTALGLQGLVAVSRDGRKPHTCPDVVDAVNCLGQLAVHEKNIGEAEHHDVLHVVDHVVAADIWIKGHRDILISVSVIG